MIPSSLVDPNEPGPWLTPIDNNQHLTFEDLAPADIMADRGNNSHGETFQLRLPGIPLPHHGGHAPHHQGAGGLQPPHVSTGPIITQVWPTAQQASPHQVPPQTAVPRYYGPQTTIPSSDALAKAGLSLQAEAQTYARMSPGAPPQGLAPSLPPRSEGHTSPLPAQRAHPNTTFAPQVSPLATLHGQLRSVEASLVGVSVGADQTREDVLAAQEREARLRALSARAQSVTGTSHPQSQNAGLRAARLALLDRARAMGTSEGLDHAIAATQMRLANAAESIPIVPTDEAGKIRLQSCELASCLVEMAQHSRSAGDFTAGRAELSRAAFFLDQVASFTPGVSLAKDLSTLALGHNPITSEPLTSTEAAFLIATLVVPSVVKGVGSLAKHAVRCLRRVEHGTTPGRQIARQLIGRVEGEVRQLESVEAALAKRANGSWEISDAGPDHVGTAVPRGFRAHVGGLTYRVHPNATKHMAMYIKRSGFNTSLGFPLSPLMRIIELIGERELPIGRYEDMDIDEWQIGVDITPTEKVLFHANFRRKGW